MSDPTVQMIVRLPSSLHAAIKEKAAAEDRTMAAVIRRALKHAVEDPDDAGCRADGSAG